MVKLNLSTWGAIGAVIVICAFFYITHQPLPWVAATPTPTSTPAATNTPTPSQQAQTLQGQTETNRQDNVTNTPTPSQQAQTLLSQFYTDINNHNYQTAYSLWSTAPQPYDEFVSGYANTRHDDIAFGDITPLSDGTVSVAITINATEDVSGGTVVSIYQGTYIVGIQNGGWKILSGNLQKTG
jgi:hypothetical protein